MAKQPMRGYTSKKWDVGIISEENDRPAYDIYFTEVSLNWIRQGKALKK